MRRQGAKPGGKSGSQSEGYVLDRFSQANLKQWNKISNVLDEYHIRLFYHLEGLRESHKVALLVGDIIRSNMKFQQIHRYLDVF